MQISEDPFLSRWKMGIFRKISTKIGRDIIVPLSHNRLLLWNILMEFVQFPISEDPKNGLIILILMEI